jgi:hypothetical protein
MWTGDKEFLSETYEAGKRDLRGWLSTRDRTGEGLCYFLNPWESLRDAGRLPGLRQIPLDQQENIDINCFLHLQEQLLAEIAEELGNSGEARTFRTMAAKRLQLMNAYMWDAKHGCYYSISEQTGDKIRVMDIGTFLPLFAGVAPTERAASLLRLLRDPSAFGTQHPVATLDPRHPDYVPAAGNCNWDGPNWPHYSWFVIKGLKDYGFYDDAARLAHQNAKMMFDGVEKTSHLRELYNTETGEGCARYEYGWCGLPAAMVTQIHLGIEPTRQGIRILPALPSGWNRAAIDRLHIRQAVLSLDVTRSPDLKETVAEVNGQPQEIVQGRGIFVPWPAARGKLDVQITQPEFIPETAQPPYPLPDLSVRPERKWAKTSKQRAEAN